MGQEGEADTALDASVHFPSGIIRSPWAESFHKLISLAQRNLLLVAPYVKTQPADNILANLRQRGVAEGIRVVMITNLRPENILSGATDIEAFSAFSKSLPRFELIHLPSLHAKVYIADERAAVVTSANLTRSGLTGNLEYGMAFSDRAVVQQIRRDFENYSSLGAQIAASEIEVMLQEAEELRDAFTRAERSIRTKARLAFQDKLKWAHLRLLKERAKGKTTHAIFADTILYLLSRGPLRTTELHPLVQQLHPDICDDSIERVIGDVHFGKRWKHHVRSAQAHLKRAGRISYDGVHWHLVDSG